MAYRPASTAEPRAEAHGWSAATTTGVFYGLKAVLDGHTGDDPVPLSEVRQLARPRSHSSATRIAEVLAGLELVHDDTTAVIRTWIDRRTGELPAGFGRDVRAWLVVLLDGDARTRPRSHATLRVHFGIVRPTTPTRWPTPTPPATFSAAQPNKHPHTARNKHESTPSRRTGKLLRVTRHEP